jgi:hypothetical protein
MATDAISVLDNLVREELPYVIYESLPEIAPMYKYIHNSYQGVIRDKGIGRQWQVEHLFNVGVAGLIESANPVGPGFIDNVTNGWPQSHILDSSSSDLTPFPSAVASPHVGSLKRQLTLQMTTGNFSVPVTWRQGDALSASQIKQVSRDVKAVGELRALTEAQSFFMASNNTLCQIDNIGVGSIASGTITFTVKAGTGRTQYFRVGMMIDFHDDVAGTAQFGTATDGSDRLNHVVTTEAYIPIIIADVDYISGTITAQSINGTSLAAAALAGGQPADDDWVVLRNCGQVSGREMRTWGLEDWIKSSGQILGGAASAAALDLDTYSQFKSLTKAVSGALTDTVMNGYVGGFLDSYPGSTLDTIITTMGVTLKYLEQPTSATNSRLMYDRSGKALDLAGGWEEVRYSFNGRSLKWMISPMCIAGYLYACKMNGGNIKRFVPPPVGGKDPRIGGDIEFLAPLGGHSSIFMVGRASDGSAQAVLEAPFWQYTLIAPVDVRGVKLTALTEATMS